MAGGSAEIKIEDHLPNNLLKNGFFFCLDLLT
jgi:hypothetical protein